MKTIPEIHTYKLSKENIYALLEEELQLAFDKHGKAQWGRHEFYAILKEEVDELWEAVRDDDIQLQVRREVIQIMNVCFRYLLTNDRYREPDERESKN